MVFRRTGTSSLRTIAAACLLVLTGVASAMQGPMESALTLVRNRTPLGDARVGIAVVDVNSGEVLGAHNPDELFIPASNMKLLASGAALLTLGPDFSFKTRLLWDETGRRLVLEGAGDPALGDPVILERGDPELDPDGLMRRLAQVVLDAGLDAVDEIVIDDRIFDRVFAHPSWPADQLNKWYCAEVGGVNFHNNVLRVYADRNPGAGLPSLRITPRFSAMDITNRGATVRSGNNTAWIARPRPENTFTFYGDVRHPTVIQVAIHDPPTFAGVVLANALADAGVRVGTDDAPPGDSVRLAGPSEDFGGAKPLAIVSTTLADVLERCNKDSHNLYAEAVLKRSAHAVTGDMGSWSSGASILRMLLADEVGQQASATVRIADGSGMSRENRLTPAITARWLRALALSEHRDAFLASLPEPGEGTLSRRFREVRLSNRVHAKSGYLNGVYSLSGYVTDADTGRMVAFSVLLNGVRPGEPSRNAKAFHEQVVLEIDRWLETETQAAVPGLGG